MIAGMRSPITHTFLLVCLAAACGGDDVGPVDSGLPAEKTGAELTADEADTLCRASAENLAGQASKDEFINAECVIYGIAFAKEASGGAAVCEQFVKMCRDEEQPPPSDTCTLGFELTTCTAAVGDIEACLTERNEAIGRGIREASCDDIGKEPTQPVAGPACTKVKTSCPGIAP
jgi:hypothetical protein